MKINKNKSGMTLAEMIVVIVIISILTAMTVKLVTFTDDQAKVKLTKSVLALLDGAIEQFHDFGYPYQHPTDPIVYPYFGFPIDCNDFDQADLQNALSLTQFTAAAHLSEYSGSEALYHFLNKVPESRKTLTNMAPSLITNLDDNKQPMNITTVDGRVLPLFRFVDPWGTTFRYSFNIYDNMGIIGQRNFPLIISAGPDKIFETESDNIKNR